MRKKCTKCLKNLNISNFRFRMLGVKRENPKTFRMAAAYLEKYIASR